VILVARFLSFPIKLLRFDTKRCNWVLIATTDVSRNIPSFLGKWQIRDGQVKRKYPTKMERKKGERMA